MSENNNHKDWHKDWHKAKIINTYKSWSDNNIYGVENVRRVRIVNGKRLPTVELPEYYILDLMRKVDEQ